MAVVQKWLRKFDMLYPAVKDGKLNIIITCVPDKLNEYIVDTSKHPILQVVFTLPKRRVVKIKLEPSSDAYGDQHTGITFSKSKRNQHTTAFTRVKTTTSNILDNLDVNYRSLFCQHPDGSFLVLQLDNHDETLVIHHLSSDFQYICQYNTDMSTVHYSDYDICCTDSGDVVIAARNEVTLYRITDGSIQNIKSTQLHEHAMITNLCFFMNWIYVFCGYYGSAIYMLDTNLNVKKQEILYLDLYEDLDDFPEVVPCEMQKYFYVNPFNDSIICDDPKKKQIKYLKEKGFDPQYICVASEDSVFVIGRQVSDDRRILQVNTDMEVLSDISLKGKGPSYFSPRERMVFDKVNARLILSTREKFEQIYLE